MPYIVRKIRSHFRYNHFLFVAVPVLSALSLWLAYQLRFDFVPPRELAEGLLIILPIVVILKTTLFYVLGLHVTNWRYVGLRDFVSVNIYAFVGGLALFALRGIDDNLAVPRGVLLVDAVLTVVLFGHAVWEDVLP